MAGTLLFIWTPVSNKRRILKELHYLSRHTLETFVGSFLDAGIGFEKHIGKRPRNEIGRRFLKCLGNKHPNKLEAGTQIKWEPESK